MENIYIGISKPFCSDFYKAKAIQINNSNIEEFFIQTKEAYTFNEVDGIFTNTNATISGSTATLTLQAKYDMDISFNYYYSTSSTSNIFKIKIGEHWVEWSYPSIKVVKSYSTKIKKDTLITFTYYKSSYAENYESKCGFYNMVIKPYLPRVIGENGIARQVQSIYLGLDNVARQIVKAYIGVNGYARPCYGVYGLTKNGQVSMKAAVDRGISATANNNLMIVSGGNESAYVQSCTSSLTFSQLSHQYIAWYPGGASVGSYALIGGGSSAASSGAYSTMYSYTSSATRTSISALTTARHNIATTSLQNKYAVFAGGWDTNNSATRNVDIYNTSLIKTSIIMPVGLGWHSIASTATHSIIIDSSNTTFAIDSSLTLLRLLTLYDYTYSRSGASVGQYAIFAGGGTSTTSDTAIKEVIAFDSSLSKIFPTTMLSQKNINLKGISAKKHAVFGGGEYNGNYVDAYDQYLTHLPQTNTTSNRQYCVGGHVGNYVLFCGGLSSVSTADTYVVI